MSWSGKFSKPHVLSIAAIVVLTIAQFFVIRYAYNLKYSQLEFVYRNVHEYASPYISINWAEIDLLTQKALDHDLLWTNNTIQEAYLEQLQRQFIDTVLIQLKIEEYFGQRGLLKEVEYLLVVSSFELSFEGQSYSPPTRFDPMALSGNPEIIEGGNLVYKHIASSNYLKADIDLLIYFPNRASLLISEMRWVLLLSFFTFLLISFVAISNLRNWYKQKTISDIKDDLINHISHEFRTPITSINVASDSITSNATALSTSRIVEISQLIRRQGKRLQRMVDNLLNTAFLNHEQQAHLEPVRMNQFLEDYARNTLSLMEQGTATIELKTDAADSPILADTFLLESLLNNLIDNAIKYASQPPAINIKTWSDQDRCYFSIADNGKGMSESELEGVFEKFQRHDHTTKGLGLGLYHVRQVVNVHQGDITVDSKPGLGTTFQISIPLA